MNSFNNHSRTGNRQGNKLVEWWNEQSRLQRLVPRVPEIIPDGVSPYIAADLRRRRMDEEHALLLKSMGVTRGDKRRKDRRNAAWERRRARLLGAETEAFTRADIVERDGRKCYLCLRGPLADSEIHLDHVVALARGGSHTPGNVKIACSDCNIRKGALTVAEFHARFRRAS